MSQQIQITGGAKVRDLQDVIIGTSGVLSSVAFDVANGVPRLDSNGKILVSQLPNSVMEYKGTWNAATNTPTLANGTGNQGDVYLCNVAGTVNFGAGPIAFIVGDSAVYSGSIWQRSGGATGSVTYVGLSTNGGAITIGSSPVTTSGTISFNFNGTNLQYVNGAGNLTTFPTLITSIGLSMPSAFSVANSPLTANGTIAVTGAGTTAQYIRGDGSLATFPTIATEAQRLITEVYNETGATLTKGTVVYINGGHGNLPTITKAIATGDATSAQTYGIVQTDITNNNNGYVVVIGSLTDLDTQAYANGTQLYLSSTVAGQWTSVKQYAPAHLVYVAIVTRSHPTQGVVEVRIQNGFEMDELHNVSAQSPANGGILQYVTSTGLWTAVAGTTTNIAEGTNLYFTDAKARLAISLTTTGTSGASTYNNTTGVLNIPQYQAALTNPVTASGGWDSNYIPKISGTYTIINSQIFDNGTNVGVGTASPIRKLNVNGSAIFGSDVEIQGLGSTHIVDIVANGTKSPLCLIGGSGNFEIWKDAEPLKAIAIGMAIPGSAISDDLYISTYTGTTWTARFKIANATGAVTINNLAGTGSRMVVADSAGVLSTQAIPTGTVTSVGLSSATSGVTIGSSPITTSGTITLAIATATSSQNGLLSSSDWTLFNNKQGTITLTTTGTSGAATLVGATLNIPQYQAAGTYVTSVTASAPLSSSGSTNPNITITQVSSTVDGYLSFSDYNVFSGKISGSGTAGYITRYTGSGTTIGNSGLYDDGTTVSLISRALSGSSASFGSSVTATSFVKTSGTSSQFLKADGSVDSSTYLTTSAAASTYLPLTGGTLTGGLIGTTATFTGKTLIGTTTATNHQLTVYSATEAAQVRVAGNAPSVVFTDTVTDPATYVAYFGMATATNNFISGSVAGDYIFHNYSGGNILFGINNSLKLKIFSSGNVVINSNSDNGQKFQVSGGKSTISSTSGSYGQFQIGNPTTNDEATMVFISGVTAFGTSPTSTSGNSYIWGVGAGAYGIGGNYFAITNVAYGGPILKLASTGQATFSSSVTAGQGYFSNAFNDTVNISQTTTSTTKGHLGLFADSYYISNNYFYNGAQSYDDTSKANSSIEMGTGFIYLKVGAANTVPSTRLTIASTGVATFSSSVFAASYYGQTLTTSSQAAINLNNTLDNQICLAGNARMTVVDYTTTKYLFTITPTGNVGIGTSSPTALLDIYHPTNGYASVGLQGYAGATKWYLTSGISGVTIQDFAISNNNTGASPKFVITSGGNVLIGTSTDNGLSKLQIDGGIYAANLRQNSRGGDGGTTMYTGSTGGSLAISNGTSTATINRYAYSGFAGFVANNTEFYGMCNDHEYTGPGAQLSIVSGGGTATIAFFVGSPTIQGNGAYQAPKVSYINSSGTYVPLSDRNKKKDFEESTIGLNAILGLKPTLYRMKTENNTEKHLGFIAQEVKDFIPQAYEENGNFIGLQDRPIIAALVNAIKELKLEIDTLKNK